MLKRMMLLPLLLLAALPLAAQEKADNVYESRFVSEKDLFFVPYGNNRSELERLKAVVRQHHAALSESRIPVYVDDYCGSLSGEAENLAVAWQRSNRVNSAQIQYGRLKEENFITRNHAEDEDCVGVRIRIAAPSENMAEKIGTETTSVEKTGKEETQAPPATAAWSGYHFALRANLLRWATLTPDLGLEWRIGPSWGIMVNGSWTSWSRNNKNRRYALWEMNPEVRYYIGKKKLGYLGAMYKIGEFNYKLSETSKQGDLMGGGITGGYQLKLNKALSMDFTLGLGYIHADVEKYKVIESVRVRQGKETKHWFGPVNAGVTLIWRIGK